jgi:hypothetical protein
MYGNAFGIAVLLSYLDDSALILFPNLLTRHRYVCVLPSSTPDSVLLLIRRYNNPNQLDLPWQIQKNPRIP